MNRNKLLILGAIIVGLFAVVSIWLLTPTKPSQNDFVRFDNQRKVLDKSIESYNYLLEDFSADYLNLYLEKRNDEEKKIVLEQSKEKFKKEAELSRDRLKQMKASPAMSNEEVKKRFVAFEQNYESALNFYDARLNTNAYIISSINGSCAELSKQNFGKSTFSEAYVKVADACIADLAEAKKNITQKPAITLLTSVEKLVKERRDKFDEVKGNNFESNAAKIEGLLLILDINPQVKQFETQYADETNAQYTSLATKVNTSVKELKEVTQQQISGVTSQTNGQEQ